MSERRRAPNLLMRAAYYRKAVAQAPQRDQLIYGRAIAAHLEEGARELDRLLSHMDAHRVRDTFLRPMPMSPEEVRHNVKAQKDDERGAEMAHFVSGLR